MRRKKKTPWNRRQRRNQEVWKKFEEKEYRYCPSQKALSLGYYEVHRMRYSISYCELPGMEAFEEIVRFITTEKRFESPIWYNLALRVALRKIKGRRFVNAENVWGYVNNTSDVEQVIRELLRASGMQMSVRTFLRKVTTSC